MPIQSVSVVSSSFMPAEMDSPFGSTILRASDAGSGSGVARMPLALADAVAFFTSFAPRSTPDSFLDAMVRVTLCELRAGVNAARRHFLVTSGDRFGFQRRRFRPG